MTSMLADKLEIQPHPKAPMFDGTRSDQKLVVEQVIRDLTSEHPLGNREAIDLVRQLSLVNLWFALKYVAGFSGPYNELNDDLHLDMCNFRQGDVVMDPGSKAFAAIPRGYFKSTIFSHGADWWELLRNPDLRIGIVNAIADRAVDFMMIVERNFDSNPLVAELFPEYVPDSSDTWNAKKMIMPNRSRFFKEPSIKPVGASGAVEGDHFDLANIDDLVGMEDLNAEFMINASMAQRVKWFKVAKTALLIDEDSRIMMVATRYAMDDPYQIAMNNAKSFYGYRNPEFRVNEANPEWAIYYRMCIENGMAILPKVMSKKRYMQLINDDPWTAITQYMNDPQKTGLAEFYKFEVNRFQLLYNNKDGRWYIKQMLDENWSDSDERLVALDNCDVIMSMDPAFTDKGISAKTSRTSIAIWAMDTEENRYRVWSRVGYFDVRETYRYIVEGFKQFPGLIRKLVLETNGAQKMLPGAIYDYGAEHGVYIPVDGQPMTGDKDARIRSALSLPLARGKVWVTDETGLEFIEEQKSFPMSEYRKDVLDESEKAFTNLTIPNSEAEELEAEWEEEAEEWEQEDNAFGY